MTQEKVYRILLWGIGAKYNQMKNTIAWYELTHQFEVVGITANIMPDISMLDGYRIVKPYEVSYDYVLVLSDKYFDNITQDAACKYDIHRNKFIKYQVLQIPNLNFENYIRLKESNISIISNNCWGGVAYNTLGLECCSPFKNVSVRENDYMKMLHHLKHYLESAFIFDHYGIDIHSNHSYPVFCLDDIKIHCNHANSIAQAMDDWNRRIKKINYENLFVEMYTESKPVAKKFSDFSNYPKKICFVPFETGRNKTLLKLPILEGQKEFWETVNSNAAIGTNGIVYCLVDLLLYGQVQYRIDYSATDREGM